MPVKSRRQRRADASVRKRSQRKKVVLTSKAYDQMVETMHELDRKLYQANALLALLIHREGGSVLVDTKQLNELPQPYDVVREYKRDLDVHELRIVERKPDEQAEQ